MNLKKVTKLRRFFFLGDQWLSMKIYSGPKSLEQLLLNEIKEIVERCYSEQIIEQFFFIRYIDPDYHLRLRFKVNNQKNLGTLITLLNKKLQKYVDNRMIWDIVADTYKREIERYGECTMEHIESLFSFESSMLLSYLSSNQESAKMDRWLWGFLFIDKYLTHFNMSLEEKVIFFDELRTEYMQEFSITKENIIKLDKKYRKESIHLNYYLSADVNDVPNYDLIESYFANTKFTFDLINEYFENKRVEVPRKYIIGSLVHMFLNRLFRSKQRNYELVIYYLMYKFYNSVKARKKYRKNFSSKIFEIC